MAENCQHFSNRFVEKLVALLKAREDNPKMCEFHYCPGKPMAIEDLRDQRQELIKEEIFLRKRGDSLTRYQTATKSSAATPASHIGTTWSSVM